jgi:hypothetical protein
VDCITKPSLFAVALPLMHTFSRNISRDAILGGKYANLRLHGISGNM